MNARPPSTGRVPTAKKQSSPRQLRTSAVSETFLRVKKETLRAMAIVSAAVLALVLPFAGRAFNVDEPLFIWAARHLRAHPLDPYGFYVNWYGSAQPMRDVMQNPPLASYCLAFAGSVLGWSEFALRFSFSIFAIAAIGGIWLLARRLSDSPWTAAAIAAFSPVFLVSAASVMCDMAMTACFICAVAAWVEGMERDREPLLWTGAAFATAAGLFKYFGIAAVLLLFVYTVVKERKVSERVAPLALPPLAFAAYEALGQILTGAGHLSSAMRYASSNTTASVATPFDKALIAASFAGGSVVASIVFLPLFGRKWWPWVTAAAVAAAVAVMRLRAIDSRAWKVQLSSASAAQFAIAVAAGFTVLALCAADLWRERSAESLLLALWVVGTIVFAAYVNWTVAARSMLPLIAPVAILIARQLRVSGAPSRAIVAAAVICCAVTLAVAASDAEFANASRTAARTIFLRYEQDPHTKWFEGHWGFQYYASGLGGVPADVKRSVTHGRDLWITPEGSANLFDNLPPNRVVDQVEIRAVVPVAVMSRPAGAGLYSDFVGPLPYVLTAPPVSRFVVRRLGRY